MYRVLSLALMAAALGSFAAGESATSSHWHIGPFFEYRRLSAADGAGLQNEGVNSFWALRPFYAQEKLSGESVHDGLWPLFTCHSRAGGVWWRAFFLAYGTEREAPEKAWSFNLLPLVFCGRDRLGSAYAGVFPIYGKHPNFLLMDNWRFCLWPLWMDYDIVGIHHAAVLWPLVTWKENNAHSFGVWPVFGHSRLRESDHWYCFWPIFTRARYDEDRDTSGAGSSWMFWPLYGQVSRARERQSLVLPPLISYTQTPHVRRYRMPWPLVDVETGTKRNRVSVWPFYETIDGFAYSKAPDAGKIEEHTRRYLWVIGETTRLETETTLETRFSIFPFFTRERRYVKTAPGEKRLVGAFTRVWPFWRSETQNGFTRSRALDLLPVRHAGGFERSWSPFWTFWSSKGVEGGSSDHSFFWSLIDWHQE